MVKNLVTRRSPFSILEVLVALAIVISLVGVVGFNIRGALRTQTYETEADRLLHLLQRAQDLLTIFNIETELELSLKGAQLVPVGTLNEAYEKLIADEKLKFTSFSTLTFEEGGITQQMYQDQFTLKFLDNGYNMPKGVLKITSEGQKPFLIYLAGYPAPIKFAKDPQIALQKTIEGERAFYERLTESTEAHVENH